MNYGMDWNRIPTAVRVHVLTVLYGTSTAPVWSSGRHAKDMRRSKTVYTDVVTVEVTRCAGLRSPLGRGAAASQSGILGHVPFARLAGQQLFARIEARPAQ